MFFHIIKQIFNIKKLKNIGIFLGIYKLKKIGLYAVVACIVMAGCSSSIDELKEDGNNALYLRGEMNDYAVSEIYRLREHNGALCTFATLRSDWAPYKFKFADKSWSDGSNFGYKEPPGVMREHSSLVALNSHSKFEEVRFYPQSDGVYRFCLIEKSGQYFAEVVKAQDNEIKPFLQLVKESLEQ